MPDIVFLVVFCSVFKTKSSFEYRIELHVFTELVGQKVMHPKDTNKDMNSLPKQFLIVTRFYTLVLFSIILVINSLSLLLIDFLPDITCNKTKVNSGNQNFSIHQRISSNFLELPCIHSYMIKVVIRDIYRLQIFS